MEAANRGAAEAGGQSIGLNIGLPLWFAHLAQALIAFPGGFGTLDEILEMLTLAQTQKLARRIPVLLYGSTYWREIINFEALVRHGVIEEADLRLFEFVDDVDSALSMLQRELRGESTAAFPDFAHSRNTPSRQA